MRVGIVGATGYVGAEVVRWITAWPGMEVAAVTSRTHAGRRLGDVVPGLFALDHVLSEDLPPDLDAAILAVPHDAAGPWVARVDVPFLVDCSRDHRHARGWVYGQPEWNADALIGARRIAAPGCFATAIGLALAPLVAAGVVEGPAKVVAATGSTGSGVTPTRTTHHPLRFVDLRPYKVLRHQHVPEIRAFLAGLGEAPRVDFVPWSAPVDRGILATAHVDVRPGTDAVGLVAEAYGATPWIRVRAPHLRLVRGTAYADVQAVQDGPAVAVTVAIDNLGRGAASQAVQALARAAGLPTLDHPLAPCP